ncbi:hypothetical protein [Paenibacillus silviterrae]|uniref:hypothetical protein n=1 Tax=Paenibacillus silviterrae TaxID=3242194 RepID=UPI002543765D|nr:hypothetical protein [Paenibacillus chinjuensis]
MVLSEICRLYEADKPIPPGYLVDPNYRRINQKELVDYDWVVFMPSAVLDYHFVYV